MPEAALHKRLQKPDGNLAAIATKSEKEKRSPPPFVPFPPPSTQLGAHCAPCRGQAGGGGGCSRREGGRARRELVRLPGSRGRRQSPPTGLFAEAPREAGSVVRVHRRSACTQEKCLGEKGRGVTCLLSQGAQTLRCLLSHPPTPAPSCVESGLSYPQFDFSSI